jgi:hypothetical protein
VVVVLLVAGLILDKNTYYAISDSFGPAQMDYVPSDNDFSYVSSKPAPEKESDEIDPLTKVYQNYNDVPGFHHWMHFGKAYYDHHITECSVVLPR